MTEADTEQPPTFADLGIDKRVLRALERRRLRVARRRSRPRRSRRCSRAGTSSASRRPAPARPPRSRCRSCPQIDLRAEDAAGAGARADPRAGAPGLRGVRALRRPPARACTCCRSTAARGTASSCPPCAAACTSSSARPGRIMDHLEKGTLDLSELRFLVLDEADEMLQDGLRRGRRDDPRRHARRTSRWRCSPRRCPPQIRRISKKYLTDAAEITVKTKTDDGGQHHAALPRGRAPAEARRADPDPRGGELRGDDRLRPHQAGHRGRSPSGCGPAGFSAAAINGDVAQAQRERTIDQLRDGKLDILVATDVAARGLDVERISHVVNYDIPTDTESYVHRIGRTGRAGRTGDALSFVTPRERHLLRAIERATRQPLDPDAAADRRGRQHHPGREVHRRRSPRRSASDADRRSSATWSPATSRSTTSRRPTSPRRWPCWSRTTEPLLMQPEPEPVPGPSTASGRDERRRDHERGPGPRRRPRRRRAAAAARAVPACRWRRTRSRSASGTRSSRGRSSARSPTRAASSRDDFGHIDIRGDHSLRRAARRSCRRRPWTR